MTTKYFWTYSRLCRLKADLPNMTKRKRMIALILVLIFLLIYFCQFQSSKTSFDRDKQKNIIHRNYANMGCWLFKEGIQDWKKIWLKINIPKVNHCILWTNVVESCQRVQKSNFQSQLFINLFVTSKIEFSNAPILQFSNLKCCSKAKQPYKPPF